MSRKTLSILSAIAAFICMFALLACTKPSVDTGGGTASTFSADDLVDTTASDPGSPGETESAANATGIIVIDAGHQARGDYGQEPIGPGSSETKARVSDGTQGVSTGNPESAVNLAIALKLRDALVARGFTVIMVRDSQDVDISNAERAAIANEANADLFIRLHCDGIGDSALSGFMTLVPASNEWTAPIVEESGEAAAIMHPIIVSALGANDRGIVPRNDLSGFNWCKVPTVLFEMGLMSNAAEDEKLGSEEYQRSLADSIADATVAYMHSHDLR